MNILIILPRFPYPLEKGDKLRAYNIIKALSHNNEISLFALSHSKVQQSSLIEMQQWCKQIRVAHLSPFASILRAIRNLLCVKSMQIGYWDSPKALKSCRQFEAQTNPDIIFCQMIRTMKYAAQSSRPKVLDFQDALSLNFLRRMNQAKGLRYFLLHYEFKMLRAAEYDTTNIFNATTIISHVDADAIPRSSNTVINILPNGVDTDYFIPTICEKEYDIVFCGNMQYKPNIDAATYLVNTIMPLVWKHKNQAKVLIAGATPTAAVRQLGGEVVTVTGTVDDIRPCYAKSRLFVAPMRLGSGMQNKLLEAMSMGVPCVTTPLASQSLGTQSGRELIVADNAETLAAAIITLLDDSTLADTLAHNASNFVKKNYTWNKVSQQLQDILEKTKHNN